MPLTGDWKYLRSPAFWRTCIAGNAERITGGENLPEESWEKALPALAGNPRFINPASPWPGSKKRWI